MTRVAIEATSAPLWMRLLAGIYDLLPLLGLWLTAAALAVLFTGGALDTHRFADKVLVQALVLAISAAYFLVSWMRGGQTIGMRAWRLRVVQADGSAPSLRQAAVRFTVALLSIAVFGAGLWWALIDRERRTWHDIASGTVLVRLNKT